MSPAPSPHPAEEYLTVAALATRIGYAEKTIRNLMSLGVLKLGVHYVKPRGRVLFVWREVQVWLHERPGPRVIR